MDDDTNGPLACTLVGEETLEQLAAGLSNAFGDNWTVADACSYLAEIAGDILEQLNKEDTKVLQLFYPLLAAKVIADFRY